MMGISLRRPFTHPKAEVRGASFRIRRLDFTETITIIERLLCEGPEPADTWIGLGRGTGGVMADEHEENKKSSPAFRDLGRKKVRQDPYPQNPARHHFKAQNVTGVQRGHIWGTEIRKALSLVGLEGERNDRLSPVCLFIL